MWDAVGQLLKAECVVNPKGLQRGLSSVSSISSRLAWGGSSKFCLSRDVRLLPSVMDGVRKNLHFPVPPDGAGRIKAFPAIWWLLHIEREGFGVGPVPVWLHASEDGQVISEHWWGRQRGPGQLWASRVQEAAFPCPGENEGQETSSSSQPVAG